MESYPGPNHSKTHRKYTQTTKKVLRVLNKANYNSHTYPLFKQSNIIKVGDQYKYEAMIFMHNFLGNKLPKSIDQVYQLNRDVQEVHETRQSNLIYMKRCHYITYQHYGNNCKSIYMNYLSKIYIMSIKKVLISDYLDSVGCRNLNYKDCKNTA